MSSPTYTKQEQEPASEEVTEVADGVLRMQLPISLPGLGHVNCYALVDGNGVALVDPGLPGPESGSALIGVSAYGYRDHRPNGCDRPGSQSRCAGTRDL